MNWGRLVFWAVVASAPAAGVAACDGSNEGQDAVPRIDIPPPPDAEDVEAEARARPQVDAGRDSGDAGELEGGDGGAPPPPLTIATGSGDHIDPGVGYGDHTCVVDGVARTLSCWGANDYGQLGVGTSGVGTTAADVSTATKIAIDENGLPFAGIDEVALGAWHSCARAGDVAFCWGQRLTGAQAEPPLDPNPERTRPRAIGNLDARTIAAGGPHTCVAKAPLPDAGAKLTCFGHASLGELNRGDAGDVPCTAPFFYDYQADPNHACSGALVDALTAPANAVALALGEGSSCALAGGRVYCWGANGAGQLGRTTVQNVDGNAAAVAMDAAGTALDNVSAVAAGGGKHACAVRQGQVLCWGLNDRGQLGVDHAPVPQRAFAAPVAGLAGVTSIGVAEGVSCAVRADKSVVCWGADLAALGDGGVVNGFTPVAIKGPLGAGLLTNVVTVAPGMRHACALRADKTVYCWGKNDRGQLGDGTVNDSAFPVKVLGLSQ